jgi:hypothetical protein
VHRRVQKIQPRLPTPDAAAKAAAGWDEQFRRSQDKLSRLAKTARLEIARGDVLGRRSRLDRAPIRSRATKSFWVISRTVQLGATKACRLGRHEPSHPSLHFKPAHTAEPIYSLRITRNCRALGLREGDTVTWFWIRSHADYDQLVR